MSPTKYNDLTQLLADALDQHRGLLSDVQNLCGMFLEPGDRVIDSEKELVNAILGKMDGPQSRVILSNGRKILQEFEKHGSSS